MQPYWRLELVPFEFGIFIFAFSCIKLVLKVCFKCWRKIKRTQVDSLNIHAMKLKEENWSLQEIQTKNQTSLGSGLLKWKNQFDQMRMPWVQIHLSDVLVGQSVMVCADASLKNEMLIRWVHRAVGQTFWFVEINYQTFMVAIINHWVSHFQVICSF